MLPVDLYLPLFMLPLNHAMLRFVIVSFQSQIIILSVRIKESFLEE
jgi:hypothetical protein